MEIQDCISSFGCKYKAGALILLYVYPYFICKIAQSALLTTEKYYCANVKKLNRFKIKMKKWSWGIVIFSKLLCSIANHSTFKNLI